VSGLKREETLTKLQRTKERRVQDGILAASERRVLTWMAARLPEWTGPDHLTLLGFLAMLGAGLAYAASKHQTQWLHVVNLMIFLNWFGDSLDGTLARHRNKLRPRYGFYVDHLIDSFGAVFLLAGMALSGWMSERVALSLLALYLLLSIHSYLAAHTLGVFRISFFRFSPTELRVLLGAGNLVLLHKPFVVIQGQRWLLFDAGGLVGILVLAVVLVVSTAATIRSLYQMERV
jgi:archaetidylinositol phosphate synthase